MQWWMHATHALRVGGGGAPQLGVRGISLSALAPSDTVERRHISPLVEKETNAMVAAVGFKRFVPPHSTASGGSGKPALRFTIAVKESSRRQRRAQH
jgi:hypothetical protein